MSTKLRLILLLTSILIFLVTTHFLKKGRIPEKYSLLWYFISLVILILVIFPGLFVSIANLLGIQVVSNLIIGIILLLLIFITMSLTIIVSGQKKKITLLVQEISILKEKVELNEKRK